MCCLEVEVWLFLKREIKILLKCTGTELSTYVTRVFVQKDREKEKEKGEERMRERQRSLNQFLHILS